MGYLVLTTCSCPSFTLVCVCCGQNAAVLETATLRTELNRMQQQLETVRKQVREPSLVSAER